MKADQLAYPVMLFQGALDDPLIFPDAYQFLTCGRDKPVAGPLAGTWIIDANGRRRELTALRYIGLDGSWIDRSLLVLQRRRRLDFELVEGPLLQLDEVKAQFEKVADINEASILADGEITEEQREAVLRGWAAARTEISAANSIDALCDMVGYRRLPQRGWLSGKGRAGRIEYWAQLVLAGLGMGAALFADAHWPTAQNAVEALFPVVILALPLWPLFSVAIRRVHDLGLGGVWLSVPAVGWRVVKAIVILLGGSEQAANYWIAAFIGALLILLGSVKGQAQINGHGLPPSGLT